MRVTLLTEWWNRPAGWSLDLIDSKALDLIKRKVAKPADDDDETDKKRKGAKKNAG